MNKNKRKMSLSTKNLIVNVLSGFGWLLCTCSITSNKNLPLAIVGFVGALVVSVCLIIEYFFPFEDEDEMAETNMIKAKARSFDIFIVTILIFYGISSIMAVFFDKTLIEDWRIYTLILVGIYKILTALLFMKLEKTGDID